MDRIFEIEWQAEALAQTTATVTRVVESRATIESTVANTRQLIANSRHVIHDAEALLGKFRALRAGAPGVDSSFSGATISRGGRVAAD